MKRVLLLLVAILSLTAVHAGDKKKKVEPPKESKEIEWLTFEEAEKRMKTEPRKVWIDIYTDWCGWCKVLDKKVFAHPDVIKYMNTKFYAIKFNAERTDSFMFAGKKWGYMPDGKVSNLAVQLMNGQLSYPTSVIMTENFENPSPLAGYFPVPKAEEVMKYLGEDTYKTIKYEDYAKNFKATWKELEGVPAAPGGH